MKPVVRLWQKEEENRRQEGKNKKTVICVCRSCRHNSDTHQVEGDGVVSAGDLHRDGRLVVCDGANVLPPAKTNTHTEVDTPTPSGKKELV